MLVRVGNIDLRLLVHFRPAAILDSMGYRGF